MTDAFTSARYSVAHAKRRIDEFEAEIVAFIKTEPYAFVSEPDADGAFKRYKFKLTRELPEPLAGMAFDAASNLRASLDQACYAVARAAGKRGNSASFPVGDTKEIASRTIRNKSRDIPHDVHLAIIDFLKPYRAGNHPLWAVNELCNTYKHNIVVPAVIGISRAKVRGKLYPGIEPAPWPPVWDHAKHEMEVARAPLDSTDEVYLDGALEVTMGEVEGIAGKRAVEVLQVMGNAVFHAVQKIERYARKFGHVA